MRKTKNEAIAIAFALGAMILAGCNSNAPAQQDVASAKSQPRLEQNAAVPADVKSQVSAATQNQSQKMSEYSRQMSEKYKNNPPVIK